MTKRIQTKTPLNRSWKVSRTSFRILKRRAKRFILRVGSHMRLRKARTWKWLYNVSHRSVIWQRQYGGIIIVLCLISAIALSVLGFPFFKDEIESYFNTQDQFNTLQELFTTLGGALLGAAAITSSLVLFAMQVNVERMPHGLFSRLSSDHKLLLAFGSTFILAVGVIAFSLIPDQEWIGIALLYTFWATIIILSLFLFGYKRALLLINPMRQIELVVVNSQQSMLSRMQRAIRFTPIFEHENSQIRRKLSGTITHDLGRLAYFKSNPGWISDTQRAVGYLISISRRYSEQGDHEVSSAALSGIVAINITYINAKGRTFFAYHLMSDNLNVSDGFINSTLEHLRQSCKIGLARGDEQLIEQIMRALAELSQIYLAIDYTKERSPKTHAHLAIGYLTNEIERIIPHNMPDVLMEGMRLLGSCSKQIFRIEGSKGIRDLTQKISAIACVGALKEEYRPVLSTGVEQLADLSFSFLLTKSHDIKSCAKEIRRAMESVAIAFLTVPERPLSNMHSMHLGPYYSSTSNHSLLAKIEQLVNAVANAEAKDSEAIRVIHNFNRWADGSYATEKETLLAAIKHQSSFSFDMIHWITCITSALLALSNAAACGSDVRDQLREHATRLISVLSFIPDDKETIEFVESYSATEILFDSAIDAHKRDCPEVFHTVFQMLLSWMFKGGRFHTGWSTLERSICGLAILALLSGGQKPLELKTTIAGKLATGGLPEVDVRRVAAQEIRERATSLPLTNYSHSTIDNYAAKADPDALRSLLVEIADLISPQDT